MLVHNNINKSKKKKKKHKYKYKGKTKMGFDCLFFFNQISIMSHPAT